MKTFSNFKAALFGLVGLFLLAAGCTAEKVEDIGATDLRSSSRTVGEVLTIKGIVYDALYSSHCYDVTDETYSERLMHGAQISLPAYGLSTTTDEHGLYTLKLSMDKLIEVHGKDALLQDLQILVVTQYDGFVGSSLTYDYAAFYEGELSTGYLSNVLEIDFPMTRRQPVQKLTADGGTFHFGDYSITFPRGAVSADTEFSLTRIAHQQIRGFTNRDIRYGVRETELERFYLHPATMQLAHPASIFFAPIDAFALRKKDKIAVTKLIADNLWYDDKSNHYKEGDWITFEANSGDTYRIHALYADHDCTVLDDVRFVHPYGTGEKMSNCNCGIATKMDITSKKVKREDLLFEKEISDELANRILRQIRRTGNIPGVSKNCVRHENRFSYYTKSCASSMDMDQCESADMRVDQRVRLIRGTIYGQNFEYTYRYTFDTDMIRGKCATTTACHQGC